MTREVYLSSTVFLTMLALVACGNEPGRIDHTIVSDDMAPTVRKGESATFAPVMMQSPLARGQVVLYRHAIQQDDSGLPVDHEYVRRLIGVPGDQVEILPDGRVMLNGMLLRYDNGKECLPDNVCYPVTLANDEEAAPSEFELSRDAYLVMSDDRSFPDGGEVRQEVILRKSVMGRYISED